MKLLNEVNELHRMLRMLEHSLIPPRDNYASREAEEVLRKRKKEASSSKAADPQEENPQDEDIA